MGKYLFKALAAILAVLTIALTLLVLGLFLALDFPLFREMLGDITSLLSNSLLKNSSISSGLSISFSSSLAASFCSWEEPLSEGSRTLPGTLSAISSVDLDSSWLTSSIVLCFVPASCFALICLGVGFSIPSSFNWFIASSSVIKIGIFSCSCLSAASFATCFEPTCPNRIFISCTSLSISWYAPKSLSIPSILD